MAGRLYAQVECFLWKDKRFLALDHSVRLTWLFLLGQSSKVYCPGLVEGSFIDVAKFLFWPLKVSEVKRFTKSVEQAKECVEALAEMGWVEYDLQAELFYLPHAINHNIPDNPNMLWGWLKKLREFPHSVLTIRWLKNTRNTITKALGRDDDRARMIDSVYRSVSQQIPKNLEATKKKDGFYNGLPNGLPNVWGNVRVNPLLTSKSKSKTKSKLTPQGGRSELPLRGLGEGGEPKQAPEHFSTRQRDLWALFLTEKFYVPGRGDLTAWEGTSDPVSLCEKLGGEGYLDVDLDLMYRLGAWTYSHKPKARKNLGSFLTSCFGSNKTRETTRRQQSDSHMADVMGNLPSYDAADIGPEPTDEELQEREQTMKDAGFTTPGQGDSDET